MGGPVRSVWQEPAWARDRAGDSGEKETDSGHISQVLLRRLGDGVDVGAGGMRSLLA